MPLCPTNVFMLYTMQDCEWQYRMKAKSCEFAARVGAYSAPPSLRHFVT